MEVGITMYVSSVSHISEVNMVSKIITSQDDSREPLACREGRLRVKGVKPPPIQSVQAVLLLIRLNPKQSNTGKR